MATAAPQPTSPALAERLEAVITMLGLDQSRGLMRQWADFRATTNRHVVRQAFDTIGVRAVFGFPSGHDRALKFSPILYLAVSDDDAGAKLLHRMVWSQGTVPILLVATPAGLQNPSKPLARNVASGPGRVGPASGCRDASTGIDLSHRDCTL
jgi:hypothetical protein